MANLPREATAIACAACEFCRAVHVNLIDDNGAIFATASVSVETGQKFMAEFKQVMETVARRPPAARRQQ